MTKALFWDFDGTLSFPNQSFSTALDKALKESGISVSQASARSFLEQAYSWRTPQIAYPDRCGSLWWDSFFETIGLFCIQQGVSSGHLPQICKRVREILIDVSNYQLYEDTKETLEQCLERGYENYLITNNYPEILQNLELLGIKQYFTDFTVSSHIGYEKPRKEFFDYAKQLSNHPEIGYVIGDNPLADIQGGKDAGFVTIAVHQCTASNAEFYVKQLSQILNIIK